MKPKAILIVNAHAGFGLAPLAIQSIGPSGIEAAFDLKVKNTEGPGHATLLAREAATEGYHTVIAAGGDGTVHETAIGLLHSHTRLGVIPSGSGNGFAHYCQVPESPLDALRFIARSGTAAMDTLSINGKFCMNVSGAGFDGWVAYLFSRRKKRGPSGYTLISLREYFRYRDFTLTLKTRDQEIKGKFAMMVFANASEFGNKAIIAPQADTMDGLLDIVLIKKPFIWKIPGVFYRLFNGTLRANEHIVMLRAASVTAVTDRPVHLHLDGEAAGLSDHFEVSIHPSSLLVCVQPDNNPIL